MATVEDIANRALRKILVKISGASLTTDEISDFIESLNDYMASIEEEGIRLGYTVVGNSSDEVTIPDAAIRGVVANMAIEMAPEFQAPISEGLVKSAREGMRSMRRLTRQAIKSSYPANLPRGHGLWHTDDDVFPEKAAGYLIHIVQETTTIGVQDTVYNVGGVWRTAYATSFRTDVTGLAKSNLEESKELTLTASLIATGNDTYTFDIYVNGYSVKSTSQALTSSKSEISMRHTLTIHPGDEIQLKVTNTTGTNDCVVSGRLLCQ